MHNARHIYITLPHFGWFQKVGLIWKCTIIYLCSVITQYLSFTVGNAIVKGIEGLAFKSHLCVMYFYNCSRGKLNTIAHFLLMVIHQRSTFIHRLSHQRCWEQWYKSLLSPCRCGKVACLHQWCDHSTIILFICLAAGRGSACGRWDHTWTLSHTLEESLCCSPRDSHYCTRHTLPQSWQPLRVVYSGTETAAGCWFEEHISPFFFCF